MDQSITGQFMVLFREMHQKLIMEEEYKAGMSVLKIIEEDD